MWKSLIATAIVAALLLLQSGCCTMTGMVIGSMRDNHKPKQKPRQGWQLAEIRPGTMTWVTLKDSSKMVGKLAGVILIDQSQFVSHYDNFRKRDSGSALLPAVGDTLLLLPEKGLWFRGTLRNVSYRPQDSHLGFYFSVERADSNILRHYRLDEITALRRTDGSILPGKQLSSLILDSSGIMPIDAVEISNDSGRRGIPVDSIAYLSIPNPRHGLLTGALIGVVLDGAFITFGLLFKESMEWGN